MLRLRNNLCTSSLYCVLLNLKTGMITFLLLHLQTRLTSTSVLHCRFMLLHHQYVYKINEFFDSHLMLSIMYFIFIAIRQTCLLRYVTKHFYNQLRMCKATAN